MATHDEPTWRLATAAEIEMMMAADGGEPIGVMAERVPVSGQVVFVFALEMVEQLRAASMRPEDFIKELVARGFADDIPYLH